MRTLVLGIGNELLADEGIGVHAARALQQSLAGNEVEIMAVGTALFDALPALERADRVIIIDAVKADGPPGTVYRLKLEDCEEKVCIASMHGFDLHRILALTQRQTVPEVVVIGVEPEQIGWSLELSATLTWVMPVVVRFVEQEIAAAQASVLN